MTARRKQARKKLLGNVLLGDLVHGLGTPLRSSTSPGIQGVRLLCDAARLQDFARTLGLLMRSDIESIGPFYSLDVAKFTQEPVTCMACLVLTLQ
jgi:hypothetical protein